ncbi:MAG: signal peptidase I [Clostridiales Family XIII bacterium]|jgi:signal peptidase|nr:signal peptidase I [Clostridiales Family XIII bacterium]
MDNAKTSQSDAAAEHRTVGKIGRWILNICGVLGSAMLVLLITACALLITLRVIGFFPLGVLSGSMEPTYHVGSIVLIDTRVSADDIATGDAIAFSLGNDTTVTHRVIGVDKTSRHFITQGDANNTPDTAPVPFPNLVGKAALSIPFAGYILMNIYTPRGMAVGAFLLGVMILMVTVSSLLSPKHKVRDRERKT